MSKELFISDTGQEVTPDKSMKDKLININDMVCHISIWYKEEDNPFYYITTS